MSSELVPFRYSALDLKIDFEEVDYSSGLQLKPLKTVFNAWQRGGMIDSIGQIWVSQSELHNILRTNTGNANYFVLQISDKYKIEISGKIYIKGSEVVRLLDSIIQSAGSIRRENYARYSEEIYKFIRDNPAVQIIRAEYYETIQGLKKKLKQKRIKKLKLEEDELTNLSLKKNGSDFSHIRSAQIYLDLADKYWNGLVVNQETHQIITQENINDEDELYKLCNENGWNTRWYSDFCKCLDSCV